MDKKKRGDSDTSEVIDTKKMIVIIKLQRMIKIQWVKMVIFYIF